MDLMIDRFNMVGGFIFEDQGNPAVDLQRIILKRIISRFEIEGISRNVLR